ncbi:PREDICTED: spindle pole body component 110-like [Dufourea novaeangliae]|uniref:spindle pole body component 110-like n=1 Tax=Dufourea novaeangliae TaxID=178035 RepID=UPI0007677F98|nr:PREDICTED: spindle pole body component 110-like [Dufourea novaeangliae]
MEEESLNNCLSIDEYDDTYKEKTRISEVAAVTLCKLNTILKQMKHWKDDRVKLRTNICRLKLALRVVGRDTDDGLYADPLVEHQKAEIKRLEGVNQSLKKEITDFKSTLFGEDYMTSGNAWTSDNKFLKVKQDFYVENERLSNEIHYLKTRLKEVEEGQVHSSKVDHLKCTLKHFMMVDHTMEIIFTDIINRVAETIANLSKELVNVSGHLQMFRLKNDNLYLKIDKLKALVRSKCGNSVDYQKRIVELGRLAKCLKTELCVLKVNFEDESWNKTSKAQDNLKNAQQLANELKNKLKNDYEALLAAGNPDCLQYIKKIVDLRLNLKQLHLELTKPTLLSCCPDKKKENSKYWEQIFSLESILKHMCIDIDKFKNDHAVKHCKFEHTESVEYLNKMEALQVIVEIVRVTINGLKLQTGENSKRREDIEKLKDLIGRMCHEITQLEVIVAPNDSSSLFKRIEELEESIIRLKPNLNEEHERADLFEQKLFDTKTSLEQRTMELKDMQQKVSTLTEENKTLKVKVKKTEDKVSELQRERENDRKELEQLQQVRNEVNTIRKKLLNLHTEKDELLKEIGKMRDDLLKKNDEIKLITFEKDPMEKSLNAKIAGTGNNLHATAKEKVKVQTKVSNFKKAVRRSKETSNLDKENGNVKATEKSSEDISIQLQRLKHELETSQECLDNANHEIVNLKARLDHFSDDKVRLEESICHLESIKKLLTYQLSVEKTIVEQKEKELTKMMSDYNELDKEKSNLKNEKETLGMEVTDLKTEKELLQNSIRNVTAKCSILEHEVKEYKSECRELREKIRNFKTSADDLASKLQDSQAELNGAGDRIRLLEFENSRHRDSLAKLAVENTDFNNRMQVLLTEKDDLTTRINELHAENVVLKDQLNKVKTENECSSVELNKVRTERDEARSENASLRNTFDETKKNNETLQKTTEELKRKLHGGLSERRVLENQLKILELMNVTLKKEKEMLYREYVGSLRSEHLKAELERAVVKDVSFNEQVNSGQIVDCMPEKCGNERKWNGTKSDKCIKGKIKMKERNDEMKKLQMESDALKFELSNLRNQNYEVSVELSRKKEKFQKHEIDLTQTTVNKVAIRPTINLYCKEINSYSDHYSEGNVGAVACINRSDGCYNEQTTDQKSGIEIERLLELINKMKIENVALKMELNNLRCNFVVNFSENEKKWYELQHALEEIRALKAELTKLRNEKASLQVRLETAETKLDRLDSEKIALKNELYTLRNTNAEFKRKANELRCNYKKFKERSIGFGNCIMGAMKKIKKYTLSTENPDITDDELKDLLKKLISYEELVQSINEVETNFEGIYVDVGTA